VSRRVTNLVLLALAGALVATGLLAWVLTEAQAAPLYVAHRVLGLALVVALVAKYGIASASIRRRLGRALDPSVALSVLAGLALAATLALGLGWTLGAVSFDTWGYSALNIHVFLGLGLFALVAAHAALRWERRPSLIRLAGRRNALRLAGIGIVAAVATPLLERFADQRRATGSKHAASFSGNGFPLTIWNFDSIPEIRPEAWRIRIDGAVTLPSSFTYAELVALPRSDRVAVIDCTGGWWSEQRWRGARIGELLARCGPREDATAATVISVTGHRWTFPLAEVEDALLATHVGDEVLSAGHGFPARLVVPERRGFQWIKWVERIEIG